MKRVPPLQASPQGLAAYIAANPADANASGPAGPPAWERFRNHNGGQDYRELRDALVARQQGLCAYCELPVVDPRGVLISLNQQVEHVRPKSGPPAANMCGDALAWDNLILCCTGGSRPELANRGNAYHTPNTRPRGANDSCGQRKGDALLHQDCDPRTFPINAPPFCIVTSDGYLEVDDDACNAHGLNPATLRDIINNLLNLNCQRLVLARKTHHGDMTAIWELDNELVQYTRLTTAQHRQRALLMVAGLLQPDAHGNLMKFWSTTRSVLEPLATQWLQQHTAADGTIFI